MQKWNFLGFLALNLRTVCSPQRHGAHLLVRRSDPVARGKCTAESLQPRRQCSEGKPYPILPAEPRYLYPLMPLPRRATPTPPPLL